MIELSASDLVVDAIYQGGRHGNAGDDPLTSILGVSNQGGFRYLGRKENPRLIVLTSNFNDPDWPDYPRPAHVTSVCHSLRCDWRGGSCLHCMLPNTVKGCLRRY